MIKDMNNFFLIIVRLNSKFRTKHFDIRFGLNKFSRYFFFSILIFSRFASDQKKFIA